MRALRLFLSVMMVIAVPAQAQPADRSAARIAMAAGVKALYAGNARTARIELLNAVKADPNWALPHALAGRVYLALGDGAAAQAELNRAVETGMARTQIDHLFLNAWLLQSRNADVLQAIAVTDAVPLSRGYALRIRANAATAQRDFDLAAQYYNRARTLIPTSSILWSDIAAFRNLTGDVGGAIAAANQAVVLNPHNIAALMQMGELVRGQYGLIAALPWFDAVITIDPVNIPAMAQSAATLGDAGRAREMLAMTRQILAIDITNADAWYLQAVLAARANKPELARSLLYRINGRMDMLPAVKLLKAVLSLSTGNSEQAIAQLQDLVASQPDNLKARRLLGSAMWRAGDSGSAIAVLEPIAKRSDADSYTLSVVGRAYEAQGNRVAAALYLDRAALPTRGDPVPFELASDLERLAMTRGGNPDNADVAVPRITQMISSGQTAQALSAAERLRNLNPGVPAAHVLVGDALRALKRPADAAKSYQAAANIQFSETIALRYISALRASGQNDAALNVLQLFLTQNPRNIAGLFLASEHYLAQAQWDAAISTLENLRIRLGNRDAAILNNLAWAWFGKGDQTKAITYATAAYAIAASNPALASSYGWMLYKTGRKKTEGIALLQKAVAIAPALPLLRLQLAQALIESGRGTDAKPHLIAALAVTDFAQRAQAQALLKRL